MKFFTKRALILFSLLFIVTMVAAVACGGDDEPEELTKVSLALDWFPWSNHSGLYVAQERGYFEDEGLEVNIYVPGDPSTVLQTVGAGRDDFGISYQPELLLAREQGIEAVSIMAMVQHPLNSVMALTESGIVEPKDLKGKKVGAPGARLDVPVTHANASYVRSHFDAMEVGIPDAPKADEMLLVLVMTTGPRVHNRAGGLAAQDVKGEDGLR